MSNDNKDTSNIQTSDPTPVKKKDRGEVGVGTAGRNLKRAHQRFIEIKGNGHVSLKQFVQLAQSGSDANLASLAKEWFKNTHGALERLAKAARKKHKGARIALEANATKQSRKKTKVGGAK